MKLSILMNKWTKIPKLNKKLKNRKIQSINNISIHSSTLLLFSNKIYENKGIKLTKSTKSNQTDFEKRLLLSTHYLCTNFIMLFKFI